MIPKLLRYKDLKELGIVANWTTLLRLIANGDFPPGKQISPNAEHGLKPRSPSGSPLAPKLWARGGLRHEQKPLLLRLRLSRVRAP